MGYKVQFDSGESVEFDRAPTQQDIDEAHNHIKNQKTMSPSDVGDTISKMALGGLESAAHLGSMAVSPLAAVPAGLKALNDVASGRETNFKQDYPEMMDRMVYQPIGDEAKKVMDPVDKLIGEVGPPLLGHMSAMGHPALSTVEQAELFGHNLREKLKSKADKIPDKQPNPEAAMEASAKTSSSSADSPNGGSSAFNDMAVNLAQEKASQLPTPPIDPMEAIKQQLEAKRQGDVQAGLDSRQAEMEQQVKQRATLEMQAADRARQEQAGTGFDAHEWDKQQKDQMLSDAGEQKMAEINKQFEALQSQIDEHRAEMKKGEYEQIQQQLAAKRLVMEQEVARQHSADFNAAERGRQEAAPTGFKEWQGDRAMDNTAQGLLKAPEAAKQASVGPEIRPEQLLQNNVLQDMAGRASDSHPLVRKAELVVSKQEQLVMKLHEQVANGKASPVRLAKEMVNLRNLEQRRDLVRSRMEEGLQKRPFTGPGRKQAGAIDPEVFKDGFEKLKKLADGTWLRATYHPLHKGLVVEAHRDGHIVSHAVFDPHADGVEPRPGAYGIDRFKGTDPKDMHLEAFSTRTEPDHQRQGLATEIYKFAKELGNDVKPSADQSAAGKALWESGKDPFKGPGKGQAGALNLNFGERDKVKALANMPHLKLPTIVPTHWTIEDAVEMAKKGKDLDQNLAQKLANEFTKGGTYQSMKTNNPVIKFSVEKVMEKDREYRGDIQREIHGPGGFGEVTRALSDREAAQIHEVMNKADLKQTPLTREGLARAGYNEKQIAYFEAHTRVMGKAFEAINKAREAAGLAPVDKRIAYAAMRSTGDFRKLVYKTVVDENGKETKQIVGIIGTNRRSLTNKLAEQMTAKGYSVGEERFFGGVPREIGSASAEVAHALEMLADKDPAVKDFLTTLDDITRNEAYSMLNMKKHTLQKKGIFGMEGRKDWVSAEENAKDFMQAQLNYAESAFKWARMSEAVKEIRPLLKDESINMPLAKQWTEYYVQNALGYNPSIVGHFLEQAWSGVHKNLGVGTHYSREATVIARKVVNTVLLGLNPMFWMTNVIQPMKAMPGMKAYLETKGLRTDFDFGTGYTYIAKAALAEWNSRMAPQRLSAIDRGALEYAKDYHVYGSDMVEHSNRARRDVGFYADKVGNYAAKDIESSTRRVMYMSFVDMLNQNGLSVKNGLYEAAHNLTDMTMNNYSTIERPRIYNSAGPLGHTAANLSSYKHNELSRISLFARQLKEEKSARPLLAELAATVGFAGVTGIVGYDIIDKLYQHISNIAGHPDSLSKRIMEMSEFVGDKANKMTGAAKNTVGDARHLLSHGGFSALGLDMSQRLGLNNLVGENAADVAFPGVSKLGDIAQAGYKAVTSPSELANKRVVREMSPGAATGVEDLAWFSKNGGRDFYNRNNDQMLGTRNNPDMFWKAAGGTGIHENVIKQKFFENTTIKKGYEDIRHSALSQAADQLFTDNKISPDTVKKYLDAQGDPGSLAKEIQRMSTEQYVPKWKLELLHSTMSKSITNLRNAQRLQGLYGNER